MTRTDFEAGLPDGFSRRRHREKHVKGPTLTLYYVADTADTPFTRWCRAEGLDPEKHIASWSQGRGWVV